MTARLPPNPDGKNRAGSGRGLKKVTVPLTKKRGASKDRTLPVLQARQGVNTSTVAGAEQIDPTKPLTEKAKLFVKYWAQGESIPSASARAGYGDAATYAYRLVHMPNVQALYREEKRLYEEASQMTRKKVMDGLLEGIEMAKLMAEPASVINGWKTVGQMCGYFEPVKKKLEITVKGQIAMQKMELLSDEDLIKMLTNDLDEEAQDELED
jgi:hypothetical protein